MAKKLQVIGDFGTDLPEVTQEDNGKVLTAKQGEWVAEETAAPLTNMEIEQLLNNFS